MKSYKNLHPQICSLENVMAAARSAMQGKMSSYAASRFHTRWETHAVRLHEELTAGIWQPGEYTYLLKQRGVPRRQALEGALPSHR